MSDLYWSSSLLGTLPILAISYPRATPHWKVPQKFFQDLRRMWPAVLRLGYTRNAKARRLWRSSVSASLNQWWCIGVFMYWLISSSKSCHWNLPFNKHWQEVKAQLDKKWQEDIVFFSNQESFIQVSESHASALSSGRWRNSKNLAPGKNSVNRSHKKRKIWTLKNIPKESSIEAIEVENEKITVVHILLLHCINMYIYIHTLNHLNKKQLCPSFQWFCRF